MLTVEDNVSEVGVLLLQHFELPLHLLTALTHLTRDYLEVTTESV